MLCIIGCDDATPESEGICCLDETELFLAEEPSGLVGEKAVPLLPGECERVGGDWRLLGEPSRLTPPTLVSTLGAREEMDLRERLMMERWMGGGWTRFWGMWVGPSVGLPVFACSSA